MKRKMLSSAGYTLIEILAALAVLSLMLLALGAGTASSVRVYRQSTALSEAGVLSSTLFEALADELRFASHITTRADSTLDTYTSVYHGPHASLTVHGGRVLVSDRPLLGEKTYTDLDASADITYSGGVFDVVVVVTDPGQEDIECGRAEFSVAPLNP